MSDHEDDGKAANGQVTPADIVEPVEEDSVHEDATGHDRQEVSQQEDVEDDDRPAPDKQPNGSSAEVEAGASGQSHPVEVEETRRDDSLNASSSEANSQPQAEVQEVVVPGESTPPTPIEKSPPDVARAAQQHERSQSRSSRPGTPLTARLFGRRSTSDSHHSPAPSLGHNRKLTMTMSQGNSVSVVLISSALETIAASREAKKGPLKDAVEKALNMLRSGEGGDKPADIFEPLRLACETHNEKLQIASLDCISKLISHSFFAETGSPDLSRHAASPPASPAMNSSRANGSQAQLGTPSLVDIVTHTITACHTESTPDSVSLQIVKALLALVLSSSILVHQSSLLKAVRTVYNIFLMSTDPVNQTVAQGGLTQMVHHVFSRVQVNESRRDSVDESFMTSPKTGSRLRYSHSHQTSQASSTPETNPLPPLTPTERRSSEGEEEDKAQTVETAVANASTIQEAAAADIQTPATERATLYV